MIELISPCDGSLKTINCPRLGVPNPCLNHSRIAVPVSPGLNRARSLQGMVSTGKCTRTRKGLAGSLPLEYSPGKTRRIEEGERAGRRWPEFRSNVHQSCEERKTSREQKTACRESAVQTPGIHALLRINSPSSSLSSTPFSIVSSVTRSLRIPSFEGVSYMISINACSNTARRPRAPVPF